MTETPQTFDVPTHAEIWATVPARRLLRKFKRDGAVYRVVQIKRGPDIFGGALAALAYQGLL